MKIVRWWRATVTVRRWNRNPYQLWMVLIMMWVSLNQINYFVPVTGAVADLARESQLWLACCNLFGGVIVMAGLHMRDRTLGTWIELSGSVALVGSMGLYVWLVMSVSEGPTTSFGLGLSQAFVLASLHRGTLIAIEKVKVEVRYRRREELHRARLKRALANAGLTEEELEP